MLINANSGQNKLNVHEKEKKADFNVYSRKQFTWTCNKNITFFTKKWRAHIEIVFNGNSKKEFFVHFSVQKKQNKTKNKQKIIFMFYNFQGGWEKLHREKCLLLYRISRITYPADIIKSFFLFKICLPTVIIIFQGITGASFNSILCLGPDI